MSMTKVGNMNKGRYGCKISYLAMDTDISILNNNLPAQDTKKIQIIDYFNIQFRLRITFTEL